MTRIFIETLVTLALGSVLAAADPAPALVAAAGQSGVKIPAGTTLQLAATAKAQHIKSPTALAFDQAGRLFLTESERRQPAVEKDGKNLAWYLDDLAAGNTSDRLAILTKWKERIPKDYLTTKSARVRRLADGDGDGVFEESKVFADGFNDPLDGVASGITVDNGCVFVACIPKLWMLRDTDNDGVADERKVLQDGLGVRLSPAGHDMSGLTLGPDGRLYGTIGDRGLSLTSKNGKTYPYPNTGCAFRIEVDGTGFEVFYSGLRNPTQVAFDAFGNAFTVDGGADPGDAARIIYLVEGGDSGWQMEQHALREFHRQLGLADPAPGSWTEEHLGQARHERQAAYILPPAADLTIKPAGLCSHPGTGFLESEAGRILACGPGGVWSLAMQADGAAMKLSDSRPLIEGIGAVAAEYSWDGRLFIADGGNNQIVSLHAGNSMWRPAETAEAARLIREGFAQRDSEALAKLLKHPDARIRLHAQIALTRLPDALIRFSAALSSGDLMERLHAVWGIGILARRGSGVPLASGNGFGAIPDNDLRIAASQLLVKLLDNQNPEIRAQAVHAISDAQNQFLEPPDIKQPLDALKPDSFMAPEGLPLATLLFDDSPRVRFFAAISIGKLKALGFFGPVCDFISDNNNRDPYLRFAGAFALQHISKHVLMLTALQRHGSPAVRLAAVVALRRMQDPAVAVFIHDPDASVADEAIRAVTDLSLERVRPPVAALLDNLTKRPWPPFMLRRLIHNAFRVGTAQNAARLLKVAADPAMPAEIQKESLRLLALWPEPPPVDQLTGHWQPLAKRDPAEVKAALTNALPGLLQQQDGVIRAAALELRKQYRVAEPAGTPPPATPPRKKR